MQVMREKYNVPKEDIPCLTVAIFARMLNDAIYAVGANIKSNYPISSIYSKQQLLNLINVLNGEPLNPFDRDDIDTCIQSGAARFREFVMKTGPGFYLDDKDKYD